MINTIHIENTNNYYRFDESMSDQYLLDIINYIVEDFNSYSNHCNISSKCRNTLMIEKELNGYYVTHQLLYTILIQKSLCLNHINNIISCLF